MITKENLKQKAKDKGFSDEQIKQIESLAESILGDKQKDKGKSGLSGLIKDFFIGYNTPGMYKLMAESILILCILTGITVLGYNGKLEPIIVTTMISVIIGFVFGKMR